ncbi:MAG: hypothetical protein ABSB38_01455 [Dehalococcoidia bacterium]
MRETVYMVSGLLVGAARGWRHIMPWFSLIAAFILGWGSSMAANWAGVLIRNHALKRMRRNIKVTPNVNPKANNRQQSFWTFDVKTKIGHWLPGLGKLSLKLFAKAVFENNRAIVTGNVYEVTSNIDDRNTMFSLFSSEYPKTIAVMYRKGMTDNLQPLDTVWDIDLIGDWKMTLRIIEEDGEILYQRVFAKYIKDGKPNITA